MKKVLFSVLILAAQLTQAGQLVCGVNAETFAGSNDYSRLVFSEVIKDYSNIILVIGSNGTASRVTEKTPINPGDRVVGFSFENQKPTVSIGVAKQTPTGTEMTNPSLAMSLDGKSILLISHDFSVSCIENK